MIFPKLQPLGFAIMMFMFGPAFQELIEPKVIPTAAKAFEHFVTLALDSMSYPTPSLNVIVPGFAVRDDVPKRDHLNDGITTLAGNAVLPENFSENRAVNPPFCQGFSNTGLNLALVHESEQQLADLVAGVHLQKRTCPATCLHGEIFATGENERIDSFDKSIYEIAWSVQIVGFPIGLFSDVPIPVTPVTQPDPVIVKRLQQFPMTPVVINQFEP